MDATIEVVPLSFPEGTNIVVGQSHFIKTAEDIAEIMAGTVPGRSSGSPSARPPGPASSGPRATTPRSSPRRPRAPGPSARATPSTSC